MLAHESRQPPSWLIFDVRQKIHRVPRSTKIARRIALFLGCYAGTYLAFWGTREIGMYAESEIDCVKVATRTVPELRSETLKKNDAAKFALELVYLPVLVSLDSMTDWKPTGARPRTKEK